MSARRRSGARSGLADQRAHGVVPAAGMVALVLVFLGGAGPNFLFAVLASIVLFVGIVLLHRPSEPPVLALTFILPWTQASIGIFHANWLGKELRTYSPYTGDMDSAVLLSLVGLAVLAIGMRYGVQGLGHTLPLPVRNTALSWPVKKWFWLYLLGAGLGLLVLMVAWVIPGLSQVFLAIANLKWAFFYMLAYAAFVQGRAASVFFVGPFMIELAMGIGGFFADFKAVFLVTILAFAASGTKLSLKQIVPLGLLGGSFLLFMVVWSAIKSDYRAFVSAGSGGQAVNVEYSTRLEKLFQLVSALDGAGLANGLDTFLRRLTYVELFAATIEVVPNLVPHEGGAISLDALSRPFMPRLFFPDKAIIDDTERTNRYTGGLAGNSEATSISLGYIAEFYIDFGAYGMFASLLALGWLYGRVYRFLSTGSATAGVFGIGLAIAELLSVGSLDNSFTKTFGGVVVGLMAAWMISRFVVPVYAPWILLPRTCSSRGRPRGRKNGARQ